MRKNIPDFSNGHDIATSIARAIENCGRRVRDGIVAPVAGAHKIFARRAHERARDNAADLKWVNEPARDGTYLIEALQAEALLVRRDLKDTICRRVADRFSGTQMLVAQIGDDLGAGRVPVAEDARKVGMQTERRDKLGWKTGYRTREIAPVECDRYASDFPMT